MRVLFYLLDGGTNASSYQRVLQYFPLLREHGIEPVASRPVPEALYQRLLERAPRAERRRPPPPTHEYDLGGVTPGVTRVQKFVPPGGASHASSTLRPGRASSESAAVVPEHIGPSATGETASSLGFLPSGTDVADRAAGVASNPGGITPSGARITPNPAGFTSTAVSVTPNLASVSASSRSRMRRRASSAGSGWSGIAAKSAFYSLFLACRTLDVLRAHTFDAVVIQRDLFPFGPPLLERLLLRRNPRLVYDTDDATYLQPGFTPNTPFQRLRRFDKVAEVVARAAWVSAATPPIADWARRYNASVSVVPMAVDLAEYDRARAARPSRRQRGGPLVIGWAGTAGGLGYLRKLAPVLQDISDRHDVQVRVISGGYQQVSLSGVRFDARPWQPATGLAEMADFDIGIVPLDNTPFEQAKFPFKLLQYLALGVPAICAQVGIASDVIRHGENGLLAANREEWRAALELLTGDAQLRRRLAIQGRETVQASYTLDRVGPLLVDGLRQVAT